MRHAPRLADPASAPARRWTHAPQRARPPCAASDAPSRPSTEDPLLRSCRATPFPTVTPPDGRANNITQTIAQTAATHYSLTQSIGANDWAQMRTVVVVAAGGTIASTADEQGVKTATVTGTQLVSIVRPPRGVHLRVVDAP